MYKKVYFSGSIRGGRGDARLYREMIQHIKQTNVVLTEHIGSTTIEETGETQYNDKDIYKRDTEWLKAADLVIAECSTPSLGVGYELALAEQWGKPCYLFFNLAKTKLSAMLRGNPYFHTIPYEREETVFKKLDEILNTDKYDENI